MLKQILAIDENYKDASRLLAQTVKLRRRRWYNYPALWGTLSVLFMIGVGVLLFPKIQSLYSSQAFSPTLSVPTAALLQTSPPVAVSESPGLLPTPTAVPLVWKRIAVGQEFPRDTVSAFATDKNDPDIIYASLQNAGVYKSIDGGLSWRPAHQGLSNTQVMSLVIDFLNPNILYAGTMDGVYKTEDGGGNWRRVGEGTYLLMDQQDSSHLYARNENGIYETRDSGSSWTTTHPSGKECPTPIYAWAIHPLDGMALYVGGWGDCGPGLYYSDNGGLTWTLIEMKGRPDIGSLAIGLDAQENIPIYAGSGTINTPTENRGLSVSYDGGQSWHLINPTGCDPSFFDPDNPSIIYCASSGLYVIQAMEGAVHRRGLNTMKLTTIHVDRINDKVRILAGGVRSGDDKDEGLFVSLDDGATWARHSNGLASAQAELKIDPHDAAKMYLATYFFSKNEKASCVLYRSRDAGKNWFEIYSTIGWCGPAFDTTGNFYLLDWYALQMTWDSGDHWLFEEPGYLAPYSLQGTTQSISANPFIDELVYDVGNQIYYSEHAGRLWMPANGSEGLSDARLFFKDQGQTLYAIGRDHHIYSIDGGRTWMSCGEDKTASRSDTRLAVDPQDSRLYLATPGQGVFISTDNCSSWQASNNGLGNLFVNTVAVDPNDPNLVYAGTDGGAFISFDSGKSWDQINDGLLGATVVYSIAVDKDGNVYAATPYGIFKLEGK
ncbi:MAG: hypothetical protein HS100_17375 [Anaerolineales bacterium]|nr:hypothetical protein [Anaerolineales bacterium]